MDRALQAGVAAKARAGISSRVPLTFTTGARVEPSVNRWSDETPYWGGNVIHRPAGNDRFYYCSTAFAARTHTGHNVMVTSFHCGAHAEWKTPHGWIVGNTGAGHVPLDSNLIIGSHYQGAIYNGDHLSSTGVPIYGAGNPALNSWVFASGGFSGASVVGVTQVNAYSNLSGVGTVGPGFRTEHHLHEASIGQGDSGGPVAQAVDVPGGMAVYARGVITGNDPNALGRCQGIQHEGRQCAWRTFHVNITSIMIHWGLTIGNTGGT